MGRLREYNWIGKCRFDILNITNSRRFFRMNSSRTLRVPYLSYTHPGRALCGLLVGHYRPLESDWWKLPHSGNCGNGPSVSPCIYCPAWPSPLVAHHAALTSPGTVDPSDPRLDYLATWLQYNKVKILFLCMLLF